MVTSPCIEFRAALGNIAISHLSILTCMRKTYHIIKAMISRRLHQIGLSKKVNLKKNLHNTDNSKHWSPALS